MALSAAPAVRPAAVAGMFYPGNAPQLAAELGDMDHATEMELPPDEFFARQFAKVRAALEKEAIAKAALQEAARREGLVAWLPRGRGD